MRSSNQKVITVNTDASFCQKTKIGGYAFWIKSDYFTIKEFGAFSGICENSTDAEIKCIINAIARLVSNKGIRFQFKLIINTDSMGAKKWIENPINAAAKTSDFYLKELIKKGFCFGYEVRHVKGHSNKKDSRSWVNNWCDEMAGNEMRKQRKIQEKIINKKSQKNG